MSHQLQNPSADWLLDVERNRRIVDGLRALGIILVIAFHGAAFLVRDLPRPGMARFMDSIPGVLNVIWQSLGSEIVFLTSGFLLCYLLIREYRRHGSIDVRDFWIRRAARILPLFLIAFLLFLPTRSFRLDQVLANLFFVAKITGYKNYIPVGWSLEVMVQVYSILPFIVLAALKSRVPLSFGIVLVIGSVARYFALAADPVAYTTPLATGLARAQLQKDLYYLTWFRRRSIGLCAAILVTGTAWT
jgi:peptidoglycan/LPS O-acetylase OafA/YrhL